MTDYFHYTGLRNACGENCVIPKAAQCSACAWDSVTARENNYLPKVTILSINRAYKMDARRRFSKKLFLMAYSECFASVHVFLKVSLLLMWLGDSEKQQHCPSAAISHGSFPLAPHRRNCKDVSEISQNKAAMLTCAGGTANYRYADKVAGVNSRSLKEIRWLAAHSRADGAVSPLPPAPTTAELS